MINTPKTPGAYFSVLDGIRGIAAIFVVLRHAIDFFGFSIAESYLAVDLFFVLSGVVIASSYEQRLLAGLDKKLFLWMRVVRIFPLYLLATGIGMFVMPRFTHLAGSFSLSVLFSVFLLPNLLIASPFPFSGVAWSLFDEVAANLAYALGLRALSDRVLRMMINMSAVGLTAAAVYFFNLNIGFDRPTFIGGLARVGYSFFAGVFVYRRFASRNIQPMTGRSSAVLSLAIILFVAVVLLARPSSMLQLPYDLIVVTVIFPATVYLAMLLEPVGKIASLYRFGGRLSYGVYILHVPLLVSLRLALADFAGIPMVPAYPWAPWCGWLFLVALMLFCWLADRFYDAPVRRLLLKMYPADGRSRVALTGDWQSRSGGL